MSLTLGHCEHLKTFISLIRGVKHADSDHVDDRISLLGGMTHCLISEDVPLRCCTSSHPTVQVNYLSLNLDKQVIYIISSCT